MSIQHIPKIFSLTLLATGTIRLYCIITGRLVLLFHPHTKSNSNGLLYCTFHLLFAVKIYITRGRNPPQSSCVSRSQEVSFGPLLAVWFPTYSMRARTQSHLLCSDTQRTQVTFMFPLTPTTPQKPRMLSVSFITPVSRQQDEQ